MNKEIADILDESLAIALSEMVISVEEYNLAKDYINSKQIKRCGKWYKVVAYSEPHSHRFEIGTLVTKTGVVGYDGSLEFVDEYGFKQLLIEGEYVEA